MGIDADEEIINRPELDPEVVKRYEENKELTNEYLLRPLRKYEYGLNARGFLKGSSDELLSRSMTWNRDLTPLITNELRHGFLYKGNIIIVIMGPMGDGKSTIGKSLALQLQYLAKTDLKAKNPKINITFSNDESLRAVTRMKPGDVLMQDEISRQMGTDSATILKMLFNMQEQIRMDQLCFIFISPTLKGMENASNVLLESFGMNLEEERNRYLIKSAYSNKWLGWGKIQYLKDQKLEAEYNRKKGIHVATLKRLQGASSARWDFKELEGHANKLLKVAESRMKKTQKMTKAYLKTLLNCGVVEMAGSSAKQDAVASLAKAIIEERNANREANEEKVKSLASKGVMSDTMSKTQVIRKYGKHKFKFLLLKNEENKKIVKKMFSQKYVKKFFAEHNPKKLMKDHIEAYKMHYIEGISPSGIAKNFGKSRGLILNKYNKGGWLSIVDTEMVGYLAEHAVRELYYPKLNVYGGKEEPDLCDDIDNPTIMVEVKKRDEKKMPVPGMLSKQQIEFAIDGNDSYLVILRMKGKTHIVEVFEIIAT